MEHALKDFVCHDHQCLASECGCLELERKRTCPKCGCAYNYLSGQRYCVVCDFSGILTLADPDEPSVNEERS